MAYSQESDLLTGDMLISANVDKLQFITDAAEEIDSKIGLLYELPIPFDTLPLYQQLLLKQINNKLASGRLVLTLDMGGEQTALHSYGLRLVTEAMNELMLIANGQVELFCPRRDDSSSLADIIDKTPGAINHDAESAIDMFEAQVMTRRKRAYWNPGEVEPSGATIGEYPWWDGRYYGGG